jgi:hypothetical protein
LVEASILHAAWASTIIKYFNKPIIFSHRSPLFQVNSANNNLDANDQQPFFVIKIISQP